MNLSYIAGFFDGEGCINAAHRYDQKSKVWISQISVKIVSTNLSILEQMQKFMGGIGTIHQKPKQSELHNQAYVWNLSSNKAKKFVQEIIPYCILKKQQLELALEFCDTIKRSQKITSEILDSRECIKEKIKSLNGRKLIES